MMHSPAIYFPGKNDFNMNPLQVNNRIKLESVGLQQAEVIFRAIDRNRKYLSKWLPFTEYTRKISDTEAYIKRLLSQTDPKRDDVFLIWYETSM